MGDGADEKRGREGEGVVIHTYTYTHTHILDRVSGCEREREST